jgi:hypothetical protein
VKLFFTLCVFQGWKNETISKLEWKDFSRELIKINGELITIDEYKNKKSNGINFRCMPTHQCKRTTTTLVTFSMTEHSMLEIISYREILTRINFIDLLPEIKKKLFAGNLMNQPVFIRDVR